MAEKDGIGLLIGLGGKPKGDDAESADMMAKEDAAEALMDAQKSGDAKAYAEAFKTMYDLCAESHGGDYEED